jgi:hypothetical protein
MKICGENDIKPRCNSGRRSFCPKSNLIPWNSKTSTTDKNKTCIMFMYMYTRVIRYENFGKGRFSVFYHKYIITMLHYLPVKLHVHFKIHIHISRSDCTFVYINEIYFDKIINEITLSVISKITHGGSTCHGIHHDMQKVINQLQIHLQKYSCFEQQILEVIIIHKSPLTFFNQRK